MSFSINIEEYEKLLKTEEGNELIQGKGVLWTNLYLSRFTFFRKRYVSHTIPLELEEAKRYKPTFLGRLRDLWYYWTATSIWLEINVCLYHNEEGSLLINNAYCIKLKDFKFSDLRKPILEMQYIPSYTAISAQIISKEGNFLEHPETKEFLEKYNTKYKWINTNSDEVTHIGNKHTIVINFPNAQIRPLEDNND